MRGERVEKLPAKDAKSMNLSPGCSQNGPLPATNGAFFRWGIPQNPGFQYENGRMAWMVWGASPM